MNGDGADAKDGMALRRIELIWGVTVLLLVILVLWAFRQEITGSHMSISH